MRLTCPNCGAQYEVADDVVPEAGRDVQCSNCGHVWFEKPGGVEEPEPEAEEIAAVPPPPDAEDEWEPEDTPEPEPDVASADDAAEDDPGDDLPEEEDDDSLWDDDTSDDAPDENTSGDEDRPEESPAPEEQPETIAARSPGLDPEVADILRTEAARERAARRGGAIESQQDLGLDSAGPSPQEERRQGEAARNIARLRGQEEATVIGGPIPTPTPEGARRDRLPDIEEINTTLHSGPGRHAPQATADKDSRARGFRLGFGLVTLVMAALAFLYLGADEIGAAVPQLEPTMTAYQEAVDQGRLWLDLKVQALIAGAGADPAEAPSE